MLLRYPLLLVAAAQGGVGWTSRQDARRATYGRASGLAYEGRGFYLYYSPLPYLPL
jgi:hypothetical protein